MAMRVAIFSCVVGIVLASPVTVRSKEDIDEYRQFLEASKSPHGGNLLALNKISPLANPEENSGKYQGDIVLDDVIIQGMVASYASGNSYKWPDIRWPGNTVVWDFGEIEFDVEQQAVIEDAILDIENRTCVRFRRRNIGDTEYVLLTGKEGGCYANIGYSKARGVHTLNLSRNTPGVGCLQRLTIIHEWMHILGILHMQSMENRDDYVKIQTKNVMSGTEHNFESYSMDQNNLEDYDYSSCMHYSPYAFSANGEPTIRALKDFEGKIGQREYVTESDWLRINKLYKC